MQKESFLEYIVRKIRRQKGDYKNKILFSQRIIDSGWNLSRKYKTFKKCLTNTHHIPLIQDALCDSNGLGMLNLRLYNAHVPKMYYDIFYKIPLVAKWGGGSNLFA